MGLLDVLGLKRQAEPAATAGGGDVGVVDRGGSVEDAKGSVVDAAQKVAFTAARVGAAALIDGLKNHPQKAAIQALILQANTKLATADTHAGKEEWPQAMQALQDVGALCATALKAANDRQAFTVKLANATTALNAVEGRAAAQFATIQTGIGNANAQAAAGNYVAAIATLDALDVTIKAGLKATLDYAKAMLTKSTANAAVALFLKPEIDRGRVQIAAADAAFASGRWSEVVMGSLAAIRALAPTERAAARRLSYDKARVIAVAAIAGVKGKPAIADRGPGLDALLAQADASASHGSMQFEAGEAILADVGRRCVAIVAAALNAEVYKRQRPGADAELAALDKHAAAGRIAVARETARKQLAEAQGRCRCRDGRRSGPGLERRVDDRGAGARRPGFGQGACRRRGKRGRGRSRSGGADRCRGDEDGAQGVAGRPRHGRCRAVRGRGRGTAEDLFGAGRQGRQGAGQERWQGGGRTPGAGGQGAQRRQGHPGRPGSVRLHPAERRGPAHQAPGLAARRPAEGADRSGGQGPDRGQGQEQGEGRDRGDGCAASRRRCRRRRRQGRHRTRQVRHRSGEGDDHVATITEPKAKKALDQGLADAKKLADAFKFGEAGAALKKLEVKIDQAEITAKAAAESGDPAIAGLAAKMVANGGARPKSTSWCRPRRPPTRP